MLGNGTGKFHKASAYWDATGLGYQWLAAGDFNGDGKLDLAVLRGTKLDMFLGNGDGTFRRTWEGLYPGTGKGELIAAADFNGDGKLDLVTYDQYGDLFILLGKGNGTFRYPAIAVPTMPLLACGPVILNDFNGDGKVDLAMCRGSLSDGQIAVLLSNGDGTFQQPVMYTVSPVSSYTVAAGDFNSDGNPDLIVSQVGYANQFSILLGNGDGTFQAQQVITPPIGDLGENGMVAGDFNADGLLDFLSITAPYEGVVYLQQ